MTEKKPLLQLEVAFAPDGSSASIRWFNIETDTEETLATLHGFVEGITWAAIKPLINAWYSDYHVQIWDFDTYEWVDLNPEGE